MFASGNKYKCTRPVS